MRGICQRALRRGASRAPTPFLCLAPPRGCVFAVACTLMSAGCIVPSYHLPAGFSSTYQRQLYGMEPPTTPPTAPCDPTAIGMNSGIFYPTTAFREPPSVPAQATKKESMTPMFLGADPLSPPKMAQRPLPDSY